MLLSAKNASLLAGVFQQTALVLIIRYSKTRHRETSNDNDTYLTSVAVLSAEIFKLFFNYILEVITNIRSKSSEVKGNSNNCGSFRMITTSLTTFQQIAKINRESLKLIIPAFLYLVQNNLLFVALSNLSVPTYQVTNQGKLLTTALISRVLLRKKIHSMQYLAIAILGLGVAVVNISEYHAKAANSPTNGQQIGANSKVQNHTLGLLAVVISCITSGFAGVYFEYILKKKSNTDTTITLNEKPLSLNCRNFQLAFWSFLFAVFQIIVHDLDKVKNFGLFHGFDSIVILVVIAQGITGFVVSLMILYADALLKGFAISVAAVVATVASIPLFGTHIGPTFIVGASMVGIAVKMYSHYERAKDENQVGKHTRSAPFKKIFGRSSFRNLLGIIGITSVALYTNKELGLVKMCEPVVIHESSRMIEIPSPSAETIKSLLTEERKCIGYKSGKHKKAEDVEMEDRALIYELVYAFIAAFESKSISTFLAFGSHIGARRHHGIIPFDENNVDFAIFSLELEQVKSIIEDTLKSNPLWSDHKVAEVDFGFQVKTLFEDYFYFSLFTKDYQGDKVKCVGRQNEIRDGKKKWTDGCERWYGIHNSTAPVLERDDFFPPFYQLFGSHQVPIPAKSSEIEVWNYGAVDTFNDHWNLSCGFYQNFHKNSSEWVSRPFEERDCSKKYENYPFVFLKGNGVEQLRQGSVLLHETKRGS